MVIIPATSGKHIMIRRFRKFDATSPEKARSLKELRIRKNLVFRRFYRRGVIKDNGSDLYYLDLKNYKEYEIRARKIALWVGLAMIAIFLIIYLLNYYSQEIR